MLSTGALMLVRRGTRLASLVVLLDVTLLEGVEMMELLEVVEVMEVFEGADGRGIGSVVLEEIREKLK